MTKRSADSPAFLSFGLSLGTVGLVLLGLATAATRATGAEAPDLWSLTLLAAIALTMRLNTFTIPPRIVVSLVYTVQLASVVLLGGAMAAWLSVGTFLLALLADRPAGVPPRIILGVVSFNVGMEALMTLAAGAVFRPLAPAALADKAAFLLTPPGLLSVLAMAITLKTVNETLMTTGSYLRGISVEDYIAGARKVLPVEAGMLPVGLLLALVGATYAWKGLALAATVLFLASVLVKRVSDTRDELQRINLDLERRVGELDVLGRVGRAISSAIEIEQVLEAIHHHCSELLDAGNFFIALLDREAQQLDIALHVEGGKRLPKQRIRLGEGLTSLVIQRREPLLIADLEKEAPKLPIKPVQATPLPTRSWLGVPMIAGDEVVGVMTVQDERAGVYDENTVRVLTTIAAQAAISVNKARLVERTVDQARLQQENRDLRLVDHRKNEFVNMVAHQLQSPLTAIMGFSELVRRQYPAPGGGPGNSGAPEHLETIHRESRRLSHLVEQLLSLSRIRSGRISPARRLVDLNAIAREVVDSQFPLIREREVRIELGLDPHEILVDADPALLHEAVANLANNALKYSPAGSKVTIRTERRPAVGRPPSAGGATGGRLLLGGQGGGPPGDGRGAGAERRANGAMAVLSVSDSGPGIAPEDRERIFEEFFRAARPETQQVKGSGLGLTIAKEIVQIHGGTIRVEASPTGGSIFSFSLPAVS